jgi:RNA polymerase sigma-70 factor, ECF subfamily
VGQQDRVAFTTLYDYFAPRVKGWTMRRGAGAAQAEDVLQDVMLQIWRHAGGFDPAKAAAATWIFTLTRNRYIDIVRKEKHPDLAPDDPMLVIQPETPDVAYDQRQLADRVAAAMLELPTAQREIIAQSYFADMPQQEIAELSQLPLGTVKSRVRLAFGRLRELLGDVR